MKFSRLALAALILLHSQLPAFADLGGKFGDLAPDFPEGLFSDGNQYHVGDFRGQILVLFFYEQKCPACRATIRDRNKIVNKFKDKPVKFIAVGAGDSIEDVRAYVNDTHLAMPVFADEKSRMEKSYGFRISLKNIYQVRVLGPSGRIVAYDMKAETIEECLSSLKNQAEAAVNPQKSEVEDSSVLTGASKDPAVLNNEAVKAINKGDFQKAIDALTKLLEIRPGYRIAQENLQIAYTNYACQFANEQKFEEALLPMKQAYDLARKIYAVKDPRFQSSLENYAGILNQLGKNEEAEELRKSSKSAN